MLVGTDVLSFGMLQVYRSPQDFPVSDQEKPVETLHPDFVIKKFLESRIYLNTHFSENPPPGDVSSPSLLMTYLRSFI